MTQALPKNYEKNYEPLTSHESFPDDEALTESRIQAGQRAGQGTAQGRAPFPAPDRRDSDRRDSNTRDADTLDANFLAHDACNWLTVLQVYCDLLRTSGAVATGYQRWIDELSSAVERGHGLVASLLDSVQQATEAVDGRKTNSRDAMQSTGAPDRIALDGIAFDTVAPDRRWAAATLAARPAAPMHVALNVAAAITRRLPVLQHMAGADIQVEFDASNNAGLVALPESVFERILHNLVSNAIEAMPNGGRLRIVLRRRNRCADNTGSVPATTQRNEKQAKPSQAVRRGERRTGLTSEARKRAASKTLLLRISDTGDGITPDRLHSIFETGISGKPDRETSRQPRGFGLAIVRELTQRGGGVVRVRSRPGRGSCFEIELPRI